MDIIKIFSYLVPPGKGKESADDVNGTVVPLKGSLFNMLKEIFMRSENECTTPIRFKIGDDGKQNNLVRNQIISLLKDPNTSKVHWLAERLRNFTTGKSGLGLLFTILGKEKDQNKLVISRFPADQGILAETTGSILKIEYVERIFMKSSKNYKSALYQGKSFHSDFWTGHLVDKQLNLTHSDVANYWIRDFLDSDFRTTPLAGSNRIANILKDAVKKADDIDVKEEIIATIKLLQGYKGRNISINSILTNLPLSVEAKDVIQNQIHNPDILNDEFELDIDEFRRIAAYKSVEFSQGQIVSAPAEKFDDCFDQEIIDKEENIYRISTEGKIIDETIKGKK